MADWSYGTCANGDNALETGKQTERRVFDMLQSRGMHVEWISEDSQKWMCGYDMVINGKRTEIKSNQYIDSRGQIVIEITDKTAQKRRSKWMDGTADRLLFVERSTGRVMVYDATALTRLLDDKEQFPSWKRREYNDAMCLHIDYDNSALMTETRL